MTVNWRSSMVRLALLLLALSCHAGPIASLQVDLDGDGRLEVVHLSSGKTTPAGRGLATVKVGGAAFSASYFSAERDLPTLRAIWIDQARPDAQLLLLTPEAGSCPFTVLAWRAQRWLPLLQGDSGPMCQAPTFFGDGRVSVAQWMGFWVRDTFYRRSADGRSLEALPQTSWRIGVAASAGKGLMLEGAECARSDVPEHTHLRFALYDAEQDRYRIEAATGACGWIPAASVTSDSTLFKNVPWAN